MAEKSSRDRKRKSSSLDLSVKATIHIDDDSANAKPIVVSFPGGLPEALQKDARTGIPKPRFLWQKLNEKTKFGRRIVGHDQHCMYTGQTRGLGYDERQTKVCIGVYNKKTGVLTLREAASRGTVFALEQSVPSYAEKNPTAPEKIGNNLVSYGTSLFEDFGTQKKRKVLKSQAANRVEINHVVGAGAGSAMVDKILKGESMSESNRDAIKKAKAGEADGISNSAVDAAFSEARRNFLPSYNEKATKPHLVYDAKKIAGPDVWSKLSREVDACLRKDNVAGAIMKDHQDDFFPSVAAIFEGIKSSSENAKHRYTCALLLNWIISFYKNNSFRRFIQPPDESKARWFGIPMEVATRCIALFTTAITSEEGNGGYAMSKANKDKCVVHALLLYMMAHGNAMQVSDIKPISADLKVTVFDSASMLRLAGCTVTRAGSAMSASLMVPLTFPKPKRAGRGR